MKQVVVFNITRGSYWPVKQSKFEMTVPRGGTPQRVVVEFDSDKEYDYEKALDELRGRIKGEYHIWYWYWETYND